MIAKMNILFPITSIFFFLTSLCQEIPQEQNPNYNQSINPKYNQEINPIYNQSIDPRYNQQINPKYNQIINPEYTQDINPIYNHQLNPEYNQDLDPFYHQDLNPFRSNWKGMFMFDEQGRIIGLLSKGSYDVYLFYDIDGELIGHFIKANDNFNLFDMKNNWTGKYLSSDSKNGYNFFNSNGTWTGNYVK